MKRINDRKLKRQNQWHYKSVVQMFSVIFGIIAAIFFVALIPIGVYLQKTFSDLQQEKIRQQLDAGSEQLENLVVDVGNAARAISIDSRFNTFAYMNEGDAGRTGTDTLMQMTDSLNSLMQTLRPISYYALQYDLEQNKVFSENRTHWGNRTSYYPDYFSVDDYNSTEWTRLLTDNKNGFMPLMHIKVGKREFDALVYNQKVGTDSYLYVCLRIDDIRKAFIAASDQEGYYLTISKSDGEILYNDLPDSKKVQTLTKFMSAGKLQISVHVDNAVFNQRMQPIYYFLFAYGFIFVILVILIILSATRYTARPVLGLIRLLESCRNISVSSMKSPEVRRRKLFRKYSGFDFISEGIRQADSSLAEYQKLKSVQKKIMQARIMEKALEGKLGDTKSVQQFDFYFPDFPSRYRLLLFRLWTYAEDEAALYTDPLQLIMSFIENELPCAYQQQISDSVLLLVISESEYGNYCKRLDFIVENINREEPLYFCRCVSGGICDNLERLPEVYRQLEDLVLCSLSEEQLKVCTAVDCIAPAKTPLTITDFQTMYTAIICGNRQMALSMLREYSDRLNSTENSSFKRHTYEMIRTILNGIQLEYPQQLLEQYIPPYQTDKPLYSQLEEVIGIICDFFCKNSESEEDPFAKDILQYIDENYTNSDLCMSVLEERFKCAASTIRKVFKNATNTTISGYIEQKRMKLADELLAKKEKTVVQIAMECGYANKNSFYKAYRRVHGHAPTL